METWQEMVMVSLVHSMGNSRVRMVRKIGQDGFHPGAHPPLR